MNYIIDFIDSLTRAEIDAYCTNANITIIKQFAAFGNVFLCSSAVEPAADPLIESIVLDDNGVVELLGVDQILTDSNVTTQFNINDNQNWWKVASISNLDFSTEINDFTVRGVNSVVYVMDSGITTDHVEFVDSSISLLYSFTNDFVDNKGHGTAIASIIAGKTCSLTNGTVKVVKIFDPSTPTLQSDLVAGFDAIITDYLTNGKLPSVVNCSWSIPFNEYINAKIQYLIDLGVYVVAAAGNSGIPISDVTPASMLDVLTMGSFGQTLEPSNFSNYTGGSEIAYTADSVNSGALDGWAPGEEIWAAGLNGTYGYNAGTSMACAITAGAIAYNMARWTADDGVGFGPWTNFTTRKAVFENGKAGGMTLTVFRSMPLNRKDLLDLSDPKYSSSLNFVTTYETATILYSSPIRGEVVTADTVAHITLFDSIKTERVVATSVPSFLTVNSRGLVKIDSPALSDPNALYEKQPPIEFELINRDGSIETLLLTLTILNPVITKDNAAEMLPPGDEMLAKIVLLGANCDACIGDDCSSFLACDFGSKPFCFCNG